MHRDRRCLGGVCPDGPVRSRLHPAQLTVAPTLLTALQPSENLIVNAMHRGRR